MLPAAALFLLLFGVSSTFATCPDHAFLGCVLRLKAQRVPFERNIVNVVFNIGTEAKLLHTCKAYSSILPCFREKVADCGDDKQRRLMNEVGKMLMFLCTPFSLNRQKLLIEHQKCVSSVLALPASTGCRLTDSQEGRNVLSCKRNCGARQSDFICMMRSWISEQNVCTVRDIQAKCGEPASSLYKDMQTSVFEPSFPVICDYHEEKIIDNSTNINSIVIENVPETTTTTILPPNYNNHVQIYRKPERTTFSVTSSPTVVQPTMVVQPTTTVRPPVVWTKKPSLQKMQYNKESWRKKNGEFISSTLHPLFTSTEVGQKPKSYKVINILKSLLPENLPSRLTSLFENSLDKHSFNPEDHYNTPGFTDYETTLLRTMGTTSAPLFITVSPNAFHPGRRMKPVKWRPWYLGGVPEPQR